MKRPGRPEYLCAALDALLAAAAIVCFALLAGTSVETLLAPQVLFGLLIPFSAYAGLWGLLDARRQLSPGYRRAMSVAQGSLITSSAVATFWVVGNAIMAFACDEGAPAWQDASWQERGGFGLMILMVLGVLGVIGAVGALVLSEVNSLVLVLLPS